MLKIRSQLSRALQYQATIGAERRMGHFDDSAKDLAGPDAAQYRDTARDRRASRSEVVVRKLRTRRDPVTGSWVGYYADDSK